MRWSVSVLRRSGCCERVEVADYDMSAFVDEIVSLEGEARILAMERVADLGDLAIVRPDDGDLVQELGKRRWCVAGYPEDNWWVEVDSAGNELPGDWEYDRDNGYVYCFLS